MQHVEANILSRIYIWMRMTHVEARRGRMYSTFLHCLAFAEASNRPYINVLNVNSLWSTGSRWIRFGCLPNVRRTAKCCLPRLSKAGQTLRHNLVRWCEATHQEFLWSINLNALANVGMQSDTGWADSLPASSDMTAVCGSTADFTLVTPVSSLPCPEKMVLDNYLCTRTYDTGASFELIFMKFACLMRVYPWVNRIVFGNNRCNRTTDLGENVPQNQFFGFHSASIEFFMEKTYKLYLVPHSR